MLQYVKCSTLGVIDIASTLGFIDIAVFTITALMILLSSLSENESLLYGEQADANPCVREQLHRRANAVHRHHLLQVCSVHLHLLQHEVGAVFEEGWRNSIVPIVLLLIPALEQLCP